MIRMFVPDGHFPCYIVIIDRVVNTNRFRFYFGLQLVGKVINYEFLIIELLIKNSVFEGCIICVSIKSKYNMDTICIATC